MPAGDRLRHRADAAQRHRAEAPVQGAQAEGNGRDGRHREGEGHVAAPNSKTASSPIATSTSAATGVFDYGTRSFRFVLGAAMKPMVKDGDGKVKPDLPKPGQKDDAAKGKEALAAWKLMKKQIKEVGDDPVPPARTGDG
ncbi:MAG: hypothetical protein QM744_19660 [Mesorhizobium sp.]